ncbi:hypothetical protein N836_07475 [Leptolyngbya sp. Heron Island J]|uniref:hypothetical protein n=1 Tax=Leptolyngbya sp. Heron Island J TaxID=1385935 RepID=UPI0003B9E123|nr:hypothetical protein [Leptolyngbya sp. Heron Island J]ESA36325.1 hypothetical protein N836_07475 [Leptolyngbya sp. Heron Island J]
MISVQPPPGAAMVQPACLQPASLNGYQARLHPWCIVRRLPKMQRIVVGRFRKGNDADEHVRSLRKLIPQGEFIVMFDPGDLASNP